MTDLASRFGAVRDLAAAALRAVAQDQGASVVLLAVVRELDAVAARAVTGDAGALGQAADSAKAAADADPGASESTREAVTTARDAAFALARELTPVPTTRS